jgi:signal peptidase I
VLRGGVGPVRRSDPTDRPARRTRAWVVGGVVLAVTLAVVLIASQRFGRVLVVSASMSPTLEASSSAWLDRSAAGGDGVEVGDIIVFEDPGGWADAERALGVTLPDGQLLITKRVLAVGGQTLSCCDDSGRLSRDGHPVDEPYLAPGTSASTLAFDVRVPDGYVWVMGDNRAHSLDSRQLYVGSGDGLVPVDDIIGRVLVR